MDHRSQVYYKRNRDQKRKGPGKVVEHDGTVIYIRHGEFFMKAHCSRVQLAHDLENSNSNHQIENIGNSQDEEKQKLTQERINNKKTCINGSDNESEINEIYFKTYCK